MRPSSRLYLFIVSYWLKQMAISGNSRCFFTMVTCQNVHLFHQQWSERTSFRADMCMAHYLSDSTQSHKVLIRLNSWLTMVLQELTQINSRLKNDFWNLIQSTHGLKSFQSYDSDQLTTQKTVQNLDSNRLMTHKSIWNIDSNKVVTQWFESTVDFVDLFWASLNFDDLFGHSTQVPWFELTHDSSSISNTWIDSAQTQAAFRLIQNQPTTQVDSPGIDSDWLETKCFPNFSI